MNFIKDSKDAIENEWKSFILPNFPNYAVFWNEFIGCKLPKHSRRLLPYGIRVNSSFQGNKKEKKYYYNRMTMAHYHLFCCLCGARNQYNRLLKSYSSTKSNYFEHWDSFELAYVQMGNVINQTYHFWSCALMFMDTPIIKIKRKKSMTPKIYELRRKENDDVAGGRMYVKYYFSRYKHKQKYVHFNEIENKINFIRNNTVHFARHLHMTLGNKFQLPEKINKNKLWSNFNPKCFYWIDTDVILYNDLITLEKSINELHELIIIKLNEYLRKNKNLRLLK
jgi:hypothetical protein